MTNGSGGIEVEMNFDAWGRRRDPNSWALLAPTEGTSLPDWLYRGYTGHEHLDQFGLINMNGRLYDPVLGRVLSPDNYVQNAYGTQDYNRYSYAHNNPLVYTDPDGNTPVVVIAALIGGGYNLWSNWSKVKGWKQGLAYFVSGAIGGAVSVVNPQAGGAITAGGNLAIDIVTGSVPDLDSPWKVAKYTGGLVLDGISAGGAGKLAGWGYSKALALFSTETSVAIAGEGAKTIQRFAVNSIDDIAFASQASYEWVVKGTVKGAARTVGAAAAKTAVNFSQSNFRRNLIKTTGIDPGKLEQAHHIFPQKFEQIFSAKGLNIHDPQFGAWWETTSHLKNASGYNAAWEGFLRNNPSLSEIMSYGREAMGRYGFSVGF